MEISVATQVTVHLRRHFFASNYVSHHVGVHTVMPACENQLKWKKSAQRKMQISLRVALQWWQWQKRRMVPKKGPPLKIEAAAATTLNKCDF